MPEGEAEEDAALGPRGLTGAAKTLCIPFEQAEMPEGQKCVRTWPLFRPRPPTHPRHSVTCACTDHTPPMHASCTST